jgi:integrase
MATITHKPRVITHEHIIALREFEERGLFPDRTVQGLFLRIGDKSTSWLYKKWQRTKGRRKSVERTLGHWPAMQPPAARAEALKAAGEFASGTTIVSKADAVLFSAAFARYLEYLTAKATKKGKPDRWRYRVELLGKKLLPQWGSWTLADMAKRPDIVADWYADIYKKTPGSAGHCGRIIRAIYRREAKRDIHLPARLPTSAIEFDGYKPVQVALAINSKAYREWADAWRKLPSDIERGYHLFSLLTGMRPGEVARMTVNDIDLDRKMFTMRNGKSDKDGELPISPQIAYALALATNAEYAGHHEVKRTDLLFPGCMQVSARAELPIRGQKLRHSWRAVAADLGIDALISHFLLLHAPKGISQECGSVSDQQTNVRIARALTRSRGAFGLRATSRCAARAGHAYQKEQSRHTGLRSVRRLPRKPAHDTQGRTQLSPHRVKKRFRARGFTLSA